MKLGVLDCERRPLMMTIMSKATCGQKGRMWSNFAGFTSRKINNNSAQDSVGLYTNESIKNRTRRYVIN